MRSLLASCKSKIAESGKYSPVLRHSFINNNKNKE